MGQLTFIQYLLHIRLHHQQERRIRIQLATRLRISVIVRLAIRGSHVLAIAFQQGRLARGD